MDTPHGAGPRYSTPQSGCGHATWGWTALFHTPKRLWTRHMGLDRVILHPKAAVDTPHGVGARYSTPQSGCGHATWGCGALFYTPKRLWTRHMGLWRVMLHPKAAVDTPHGAGARYSTPQSGCGHATWGWTALFYTPKRLWTRHMGLDRVILHPKAAVDTPHGAGARYSTPQRGWLQPSHMLKNRKHSSGTVWTHQKQGNESQRHLQASHWYLR
jgi:hypothetical protein